MTDEDAELWREETGTSEFGPLVKPRGKGGGRKPKGGGRIGCRLSQPAMDAIEVLTGKWGCDVTAVVERALVESLAGVSDAR